ncbi:ABC transporter ATP-binding protein [Entomospira culicis]|uniref:ABC transporter ATP-binding protein n=1 Tax=Entomospira culicis TaxID=2719989 RepID=A0A968GGZ5_9SPIO|nr:ABC transporter ATP-binding protein [Entomospira culicis]NIZ19891.1 ABC transporter ATP-binding protein [Entomospira culicis]NIZ70152.1 ABC transporter ATP-binding protein [Entomospira culicis]WDI37985.1 ABC transporter ATP-binding protein [Entomospira culicis]WDI39608.1 ABC transporter ATP-binding protein [Entomospira culicis]
MLTLSKHIRQYKIDAIITPIFVIIEVIVEVFIPLVMAKLIDEGISAGNMQMVRQLGLLLFGMAIISASGGLLAGRYSASAATGLAKNLRLAQFRKIQSFTFSQIDRFSTSSLITRLTNDVNNVQNAFQTMIGLAVRTPIMITLALIAVFSIHQKLSLIFLLFMPLLLIGMTIIVYFAHPMFGKIMGWNDKLNKQVQENIKGIRVVKSFVQEEQEIDRMADITAGLRKQAVQAESLAAFFNPLVQFSLYGATLMVAWFGAKLVIVDALSTGQLMSFFAYLTQILINLMLFAFVFVQMMFSQASIKRIKEVLNQEVELESPAEAIKEVPHGSIRFENVSFGYDVDDAKEVLHDINLDIPAGSTIGILGETGSGKSSLVQLIARLYDVKSGRVLVGDHDVRDYDLDALRNQVAMVLQKNELFSGTIAQNLRWGDPDADLETLQSASNIAQADPFIQKMQHGYESVLEQGATNLSGGQRQRLCIARALLKKPKILILDDSMSAVDTKTDAQIRQSLIAQANGMTKIIIAGRISSVLHADRIIYLERGNILDQGSHADLLARCAAYQELYASQSQKEPTLDV